MSKPNKKPPATTRTFKLLHQSLVISDINFKRRALLGSTELTVLPLTSTGKIWKLPLNCKQCRILRVTINGNRKTNFTYVDPTLCICPPDTKKRNLEYFSTCHSEVIKSCDSDYGSVNGELVVKIPRDTYDSGTTELSSLKVMIDFSLEQPVGGVQFVTPQSSTETLNYTHMFTYGWENASRLWFPCVDSYTELCHWSISFTVPTHMVAISCGDLTEQVLSSDGRKKTYHYVLSTPTPAPLIAFAAGCFEVYPDPVMQEVTHFCLPGLMPILKNTVQFVNEVFGFCEELMSSRFPHSSYKLVFVEHSYQEAASYATLGIFSTHLLHSSRVIEQAPVTRKIIAQAIAKQYFGCYMLPQLWNDWWLPVGMAGFIAGLFVRRMFGSTEYQHWVMQEHDKVCQYEMEHSLPPLCGTLAALQVPSSLPTATSQTPGTRLNFHPQLVSEKEMSVMASKSHLVLRMIQLKIGHDLLLQVFNKLLTLALGASQSKDYLMWHNMFLSTGGFMKLVLTVTGKDLSHFMDQWVLRSGIACFHSSYTYTRKKNQVELRLVQDPPRGYCKFMGSMTVVVQEFDGCFTHSIQVEENSTCFELPCHSKIRKAKKRKMPLIHGEEIEIDVSSLDTEVPVMWLRVDPEMQWIRRMNLQQPDTVWQNIVKYERDAVAQLEAINSLRGFPSTTAQNTLRDAVLNTNFYCHVRVEAAAAIAKVLSELAVSGGLSSPDTLIRVYQQLFCLQAYPHTNIVKYNDFSDFSTYLVQKSLPKCASNIRNAHQQCPREVLSFLLDLFKYSDNQDNKYSDSHYRASLISALADYTTPKVSVLQTQESEFTLKPLSTLQQDVQSILQLVVEHLNIEKVLPSYKHLVTASCLNVVRTLQKTGHLPVDSALFREYAQQSQYIDVRLAALEALADIVHRDQSESDLNFLLDIVDSDFPYIRVAVLNMLSSKPPFSRKTESVLNTLPLVERLWTMMCSKLSSDSRIRNSLMDFYGALYGRLTPSCVPQGLGVVIDLKEKVARSSVMSPVVSPKPLAHDESADPQLSPVHPLRLTISHVCPSPVDSQLPALFLQPSSPPPPQAVSESAASSPIPTLKFSLSRLKHSLSRSPESIASSAYSPSAEEDGSYLQPPKRKKRKATKDAEATTHKKKHKHKERKHKRRHKE